MTFASLFLTHFLVSRKLDDPKGERRVFPRILRSRTDPDPKRFQGGHEIGPRRRFAENPVSGFVPSNMSVMCTSRRSSSQNINSSNTRTKLFPGANRASGNL